MDQPTSALQPPIRPADSPCRALSLNGVIRIIQSVQRIAMAGINASLHVLMTYPLPCTRAQLGRMEHACAKNARRRGDPKAQQATTSVEEMIQARLVEDNARQICELIRESA
jgi:hypothetical protein